ncbi:MAG: ParB/RepB/Spo0J family partition protein [Planctomycetota bacterium]|jgi:ParB-like chromosome segregation protein Spo0J
MRETKNENRVSRIAIEKLVAHPDNPNRMSKRNFVRLVRNIERTGRYEPLMVRPCPDKTGHFQIINGHHRCQALLELGYKTADVIVWDIDDRDTEILLATINRLGGSDILEKKRALLRQLNRRMQPRKLAKLLPLTHPQIHRLTQMRRDGLAQIKSVKSASDKSAFANPLVFFVDDKQQKIVQEALSLAGTGGEKTKAARNAMALTCIARRFIEDSG